MATLGRRDTGAVVGRVLVVASGALMCLMEEVFAASVRTLVAPVTRRTSASIRSCRPCPLREQCQWQGYATKKPRQVSMLLHPLTVGVASLLWHDWSQRQPRRACMQLRSVLMEPTPLPNSGGSPALLSRALALHMSASVFKNGWFAMPVHQRLTRSLSSCSVSQRLSPPSSAS